MKEFIQKFMNADSRPAIMEYVILAALVGLIFVGGAMAMAIDLKQLLALLGGMPK